MSDAGRLIKVDGPRLGHIPAFDGFRGLFVLQVVLYHALVTDFLEGSPIIIDWFFVASGFLITSLLLDERRATDNTDLRRFYQRRALRLFPAMYLMIAVPTVILIIAVNFVPAAREQLGNWWIEPLAAATYCYYIVAAFMPGTLDGVLGHTWSLTVEEQFYFIWPLIFLAVDPAQAPQRGPQADHRRGAVHRGGHHHPGGAAVRDRGADARRRALHRRGRPDLAGRHLPTRLGTARHDRLRLPAGVREPGDPSAAHRPLAPVASRSAASWAGSASSASSRRATGWRASSCSAGRCTRSACCCSAR